MCKRVTQTRTHIYYIFGCMYTCKNSDASIEPPLRTAVPTPKAPRKPVPARVRTRARIGDAATHNRPRRTEAPAERVRHSARRRAGSGAYIVQRGDGRGVPRADVRVESRRRVIRLRAEAARGRRRREGLARLRVSGFRPSPQHEPANACAQSRSITHRTLVHAYITPTDSHICR